MQARQISTKMAFSSAQLTVPPGFPELLQGLAKEVLRNQPKDIVSFAHEHFAKMVDDRTAQENHENAAAIEQATDSTKPNKNIIIPTKTNGQKEDEQAIESEEELPALDSFNNDEVSAITKIQSGFRGMQARKQVHAKKTDGNEAGTADSEPKREPEKEDQVDEEEDLPALDSFDQNEVNAITKIQSGFRGMQARKQVQGLQQENTADEPRNQETETAEDELPDLNSFDQGEVHAISKIQAGFRGMKARKEVKNMNPNCEQEAQETGRVENTEEQKDPEDPEELPDLNSFDQSEVSAITKIQSGFRGMKARQEVNEKKTNPAAPAQATTTNDLLSPRTNELPPSTAASQAASQAVIPNSPRDRVGSQTTDHQVNVEKIESSDDKPQQQPTNQEDEEELPDLNSFDQSEVNAISKIQAGFRGMKARKDVSGLKKKDSDAISAGASVGATATENPPQQNGQEDEEELPALDSFDTNEVNAITKIQAGFRGMQARKDKKPAAEQGEDGS